MDQLLILATLCELLLQHYFYALHDSTWNHGNPPSIPLLFVRITEKKIDFSKNHKLQKISRATYSGLHRVTTLAYVIIRSMVTLFFLKFWGLGPNFKEDGKRYLLWEKLDLILHMIACGLIRFEFDWVTYFNKFLAWHWTCKIRFKRMPGKAAFWGSLRPF